MHPKRYTFNFKDGPITVCAINLDEAEICAKAEAIRKGWDYHIDGRKKIANPVDLTAINNCIMHIIEMEDTDTFDEQLDCIEALKRLLNKLKQKEVIK